MVRAHECWMPTLTLDTPDCSPVTGTAELVAAVEPLPSWPMLDTPQHQTAPPVTTAQACEELVDTELPPLGRPLIGRGVKDQPPGVRVLVSPAPQQRTPPDRAHVWPWAL